MKKAEAWAKEINSKNKSPDWSMSPLKVNQAREIQADALEHTCQIMAVHADDPAKAFSAIFKLKESLRPKPTPK